MSAVWVVMPENLEERKHDLKVNCTALAQPRWVGSVWFADIAMIVHHLGVRFIERDRAVGERLNGRVSWIG